MKKLILFTFILFLISSCTRTGNNHNSKIQIKLPNLSTSYSNKVGVLNEPSNLSDINCYMVLIGGPEADLQRSSCPTKGDTSAGIASKSINFGILHGGIAPSTEISFEVPSGNDRVIHLVGMRVMSPAICRNFKTEGFPENQEASRPYLIGTADRLLLEPSKTVEVPITMNFNLANRLSNCTGPDVPQGDGDSDGDNGDDYNQPYLRFEGLGRWNSLLNKELGTIGHCYEVKPSLYQNSTPWIDTAMNDLSVDVSNNNAGYFYSDASCTTQISSLTIPAGNHRSISSYYFKTNNPLNNISLSGWSISGGSTSVFQNAQQIVDFNYPKLVVYGPEKIPLNMCAKFKIQSEYYEGGELFAPAGGITINLTDNAGFYLRGYFDCTTVSSASIAPATSSTNIYLKLMSAVPVSLDSFISAPNYISNSYLVQNSLYKNYTDSISVTTKDNIIKRGVCNSINIRLINFDEGAATAKHLMTLTPTFPQGAGSIYTLPDCSGAPVSSVSFSIGESELNIGFKANSLTTNLLVGGMLPMRLDAGSLRIKGIAPTAVSEILFNVTDTTEWHLHANPPSFNGAEIVGSHEFTDGGSPSTYKEIILNGSYDALSSVECSNTPGTGFGPCSGSELDNSSIPYKFKWTSVNAVDNIQRYVRFNFQQNGHTGYKDIKISGDSLYGNKFKVVTCGSIAAAGSGTIEDINTHTAGVVCLPASSTYTRTGEALTMTASTRTGLIGHSSGTSILNANDVDNTNVLYIANSNSPELNFFVANLKFRGLTNSPRITLNNPVATSSITAEFNNIDIDDEGSAGPINMIELSNNDPDINIKIRNTKIITTGSGNSGIAITNANNFTIENTQIETIGNYGIYISNSVSPGNNIKILNSNVKTNGGSALYFSNNGASDGSNIEISNSKFKMTSPGNGANPIVKLTNKMNGLIFDNNVVEAEPGVANLNLLLLYNITAGQFANSSFRTNSFIQGSSQEAITIGGGQNIDLSDFSNNSFVSTGFANNSVGMFSIPSTNTLNIGTNTFDPVAGANLACSNNPSYIFTNPFTNNGTIGGGLGLGSIPVIMDNMSAISHRCKGNL